VSIIFGLIIISLLLAGGFLVAFLWAARSGQFEDDFTPSVRMLFDDEPVTKETDTEKPELQEVKPSKEVKQGED
jgi:cbb3-type cytochrome oxidase maturation protein